MEQDILSLPIIIWQILMLIHLPIMIIGIIKLFNTKEYLTFLLIWGLIIFFIPVIGGLTYIYIVHPTKLSKD